MQRAFRYNMYEHEVKFPLATLFWGQTQGQIQFLPWVRTWVRSPRLHREVHLHLPFGERWNKREKVKKEKNRAFILIAKDVFVALSVVVAKAPYIHEIDSSILVYCKLVWSKTEKYPDSLDKLFTLQNMANLQDIGSTLDFGFKIYRDTFSIRYYPLHLFKNDKTNPVTKLPRKVRSLKLHVRQMIDMHQSMDPNTRQSILQVANVISYMQKRLLSFGELFVPLKKSWLRPWQNAYYYRFIYWGFLLSLVLFCFASFF